MSKLSVKTIGNSSPQGKPRVYFSCHPEDFNAYFEPLCADIFATQNCAVYYESDWETPADEAELAAQLGDMQLFVVPLTTKFLTRSCRARDYEYGFAMEQHIPILPIAVEYGIDRLFAACMNRVGAGYGDIQFLNKVSTDATEIPYAEKLEKLLGGILVGDELAERVRAAFDAYIFLSYRKKDRACAKELMKLIHRIPYCQDIAIWYDEFLVPGEGWNQAIMDAMAKSRMVTLAVTPSLLEPDNFIIQHEYPDAVKAGKDILPAELEPTDRDMLADLFDGIGEPVDGQDEEAMKAALQRIAVQENDTSPEHNFLIGLAYLSAIDVERDPERAVRLITSAAEAELPEAMEKLVSMYNTGEGVERNYLTAVEWQEKLVTVLEKTKADPLADRDIVSALWNAGDMWKNLSRLNEAERAYTRMHEYARQRDERYHFLSTRRDLAVSYNKLGDILSAQGKPAGAEEHYRKSLKISEELAEETNTVEARRDLSISYNKMGDILKAQGKPAGAEEYYRKDLKLSEELAEETKTVQARRDLSVSYNKLGDILSAQGKPAEAEDYYRKDLKLSEELAEETKTVQAYDDLAISYYKLGCITEDMELIRKAYDIYRALAKKYPGVERYAENRDIARSRLKRKGSLLSRVIRRFRKKR